MTSCHHDGTVRVVGAKSCYWKGVILLIFRASTADQVVPRARTSSRTNVHSDANLPT
jgi:hypothetical protein